MAASNWFLGLFIVVGLVELGTCKKIKILSNFTTFEDEEFFKTTYPWIAKHVPELRVNYYFKDQDGGKRMCVLENLKHNINLQAHYLSCEADSKENCLKDLPLDQRRLEKCYWKSHNKLKAASKEFRKHGTNETPLIVRGKVRQTVHDPTTVLLRICGMFGRKQPQDCRQPSKAPVPAKRPTTPCTQPATEPTRPEKSELSEPHISTQELTLASAKAETQFSQILTNSETHTSTQVFKPDEQSETHTSTQVFKLDEQSETLSDYDDDEYDDIDYDD
ncbi:uncharacterized protein LOC134652651 [Cydia amplana]|uniref:uncharacterized protein LOC134652651 n=1 Tax=Cydia amplana TaxID=1869771 RepID=UPI002FE534CD